MIEFRIEVIDLEDYLFLTNLWNEQHPDKHIDTDIKFNTSYLFYFKHIKNQWIEHMGHGPYLVPVESERYFTAILKVWNRRYTKVPLTITKKDFCKHVKLHTCKRCHTYLSNKEVYCSDCIRFFKSQRVHAHLFTLTHWDDFFNRIPSSKQRIHEIRQAQEIYLDLWKEYREET